MDYRSDSPFQYIFWIFRKPAKATSIKASGLYPDFRLKYCGKEVFFSQATLAINVCCTKFLIPSEIQRNNCNNIKCIFYFGVFQGIKFSQGFFSAIISWDSFLGGVFPGSI